MERQDLVERGAHGLALPEAVGTHEDFDRVGLDPRRRPLGSRARRPREARDGAVVDPVRAQVERERRGRPVPRRPRLTGLLAASSAARLFRRQWPQGSMIAQTTM